MIMLLYIFAFIENTQNDFDEENVDILLDVGDEGKNLAMYVCKNSLLYGQ